MNVGMWSVEKGGWPPEEVRKWEGIDTPIKMNCTHTCSKWTLWSRRIKGVGREYCECIGTRVEGKYWTTLKQIACMHERFKWQKVT